MHYTIDSLNAETVTELFDLARDYYGLTYAEMERQLSIPEGVARHALKAKSSKYADKIKEYLVNFLSEKDALVNFGDKEDFDFLFKEANLTNKEIAEALNISPSTVSLSRQGKTRGKALFKIRDFLENVINNQYKPLDEAIQQDSIQEKEQETMTEETLTDTKEMKTYDEFLNFINTQKELPIVKKALDETLSKNQNLDKILAKEEFITIETALKLLQISEEDYKKMLEGADKVSNKTADKIYKAISAFDEFYRSEKTQDTINNTKNTFVTGFAIASAKSQTFLNKGLNKFADFLNKSADKIKNSNSENKED